MKITKNLADFARETGLPPIGTEEELAQIGAIYLSTRPVNYQGSKLIRDVMVLHRGNGEIYIWNREFPGEKFMIHRSGQMMVEYEQPNRASETA